MNVLIGLVSDRCILLNIIQRVLKLTAIYSRRLKLNDFSELMTKKDKIKIFIDEVFSSFPTKKYPTNKIVYNYIDEIWSIYLIDMLDYGFSNNKGYRYILTIFDNFSKYFWCVRSKNKFGQTIRDEFSTILTTSKREIIKIGSDRGGEFFNFFQSFLKYKILHHFSRYSDKGPS